MPFMFVLVLAKCTVNFSYIDGSKNWGIIVRRSNRLIVFYRKYDFLGT